MQRTTSSSVQQILTANKNQKENVIVWAVEPGKDDITMYIKINGKMRSLNRVLAAIAVAAFVAAQAYILPNAVHAEENFQQAAVDAYRK